jgi:alanyl aminopeptidase
VPKADAAFFNTPPEGTAEEGELKTMRFAETKPLPSYLLAFGVGPFDRVDGGKTKSGAPVGIVVTKGKTSWAKYSAQSSPKIMDILEDWFQIPYHYPKLDLIEVPLGGGAMENPGLITFAQRINLARPGTDTPQFHRRAADVEAHEFAHLWFGDMVTTAWWDDLWLNEAFATWMTFHAIEKFAPSWGTPAERADSLLRAMYSDRLLSARRIRQPIQSEGDIKTAFDGITYQKGAAVIRMFEEYVGEDAFRSGVQAYLKKYADGNATAKEFLAEISRAAGRDVSAPFSTFLDQGGLPLVTAQVSCEGGKGVVALSQARYLPMGAAQNAPPPQTWQIPVCVRTDQGKACTLLAEKTGSLELGACPRWVMPNAGGAGYYRTALGDAQIAQLTQNAGSLTAPEKMIFFSDVVAAAQTGAVAYPRAFELAAALAGDKDRHVVKDLIAPLEWPDEAGLVTDALRSKYAAYVRGLFEKRARALGFAERKGEPEDTRILRPSVLEIEGDQGEDPQVRAQARKVADRWLKDHNATSPELASTALYLSAISGDAAFYDRLHAAARAERNRVERQRILAAMSGFRDLQLIEQGFRIALSDEFDPRESIVLVWGTSFHAQTREAAVRFVEQNFDALVQRLPRDSGAGLVGVAAGYCDDGHRKEVEQFFAPRARLYPGGERRYAQAVEQIRQCVAFREKAAPALSAWLEQRLTAAR